MVKLTIDTIKVEVPAGATILEAAKKLGTHVPTLCHHEALTPYGGCRLCVVEVAPNVGDRIVASCSFEATEGLEVKTVSPRILEIRKFIVGLLLAEAPQSKVLQDLAAELDVHYPDRFKARNELCIACGLCIRACREIVGVSAIDFAKRGYEKTAASPFFRKSEDCIGCGTCAAICPTGAITLKDIAEGQKGVLPDGETVKGPARIIDNWKVAFDLKRCKTCGEPFAPRFQLEHFARKAALPDDFYDVCVDCRAVA